MSGKIIDVAVSIQSKADVAWKVLTDPELMKQWMSDDDELRIEMETDWEVGGNLITRGFHHVKFENTGKILELIPGQKLVYTHLSSISGLKDLPENHCIFEFSLREQKDSTLLRLSITNFPTETIYKHLELYWRSTLTVIKRITEQNNH